MKLKFFYTPRYGKHRWLPDCQLSWCLAKLAKRQTFDQHNLALLETNGFDITLACAPNFIVDPNTFTGKKK